MITTTIICVALSVAIAIASLVSYLEEIGENIWAASVLATVLIIGWSFIIYMSTQDVA